MLKTNSIPLDLTFFNRCYWPDSEAAGQLLTELSEFLSERHRVRVVVGQPNSTEHDSSFLTNGVENRNGVEIHRLQHSQASKGKRFGRMKNFVSFMLAVRRWLKHSQLTSRTPVAISNNAPIWICETDPFLMPLVVGPAARRHGAKVIYYIQDIYPDIAVAVGVTKNQIPIRMLRHQLMKQYTLADRIVVLDQDMKARLVNWGIEESQMSIVPNWMDCSTVQPVKVNNRFRDEWRLQGKFAVMHSGNMGATQNLDVLVHAMKHQDVPDTCQLLLVGNGAKRKEIERLTLGQQNVSIFDYQPREKLAESLSVADLHVVSMDAAITGCLAPSKLYGILASGSPILAIVPPGNAISQVVSENGLGWCVKPGDSIGIAKSIQEAVSLDPRRLSEMGRRGRHLAETLFDRDVCCGNFEKLLEGVSRAAK